MLTRRAVLLGAAAALVPVPARAKGGAMGGVKKLVVLEPHPDDLVLSKWPTMHYIASGYETHVVHLTRGEVTPASLRLDGSGVCGWHGYTHNPAREGYTVPTKEQIGLARLAEARSAIGAMASVPPVAGQTTGAVFVHDENLGTHYGAGGGSSSTAPVVPEAVDAVEEIIRRYLAELGDGTIFFSMSHTDAHCDHRASGMALRRLKGVPHVDGSGNVTYTGGDPVLSAKLAWSRFFVSKLYWNTPAGQPGSRVAEPCSWYPNKPGQNTQPVPRSAEYTEWLQEKVVPTYKAWNPAQGSFAVGGIHSTPAQFASCFNEPLPYGVSALWHP